ncbi:MAG: hypothetical protein IH600_08055 [Bacteroidetes bacterium]|nr:hypothetical protein [Bacteroidota bacterium]
MKPSIHYYILSLGDKTNRLFEAFRDDIIDIHDSRFPHHFPYDANTEIQSISRNTQLRTHICATEQRFNEYYERDPLGLVLAGSDESVSVFESFATHPDGIVGALKGDYTYTSAHDLGKIVWPIIREAMSGKMENALLALESADGQKRIIAGIDAVAASLESSERRTLFVEEDYRMKGGMSRKHYSHLVSKYIDLGEIFDDIVDIIIEKVLEAGGKVVFMDSGSLVRFQRISLIRND